MLLFFGALVALGIYLGGLFFGNNSFEVLNALEQKQETLQSAVQNLQYEKAKLQKQLFELKELEPKK
ncbi:hypothetical protein HBZC1_07390 [Helicobacter bizzozeronii CIII-1]|uniref:Uncharacterized protein n=1 Tax=Helicobacter bizzozeronii (strain CIII-1) TaxID=1002804 RepID=F8KSF6_HELBC|nr:hypothetical protein [Helicobacter bizzozeronii]CCB79725.1 hypothetical protein HBZC1_07390 [Helicobacter bizzozeronii CIII-1]